MRWHTMFFTALATWLIASSGPAVSQGLSHRFGGDWRGDECLVADPTGTPFNIRRSPAGQVVTTVTNGEGVVVLTNKDADAWVRVAQVRNGRLTELGFGWSKFIDCKAGRISSNYPVFFSKKGQLLQLGIAWLTMRDTAGFVRCPYQGEGHTIEISKEIVEAQKARGFSLSKLCVMLVSGQVRYDPETGERLPTYLFAGWPDYGFFPEEYLLKVPDCFKGGSEIVGRGTAFQHFKPTACTLNFHPWTGRKISASERGAYASALTITAGGEAGPDMSPERELRESRLPPVPPATLSDLKKQLTK